MSDRNCFECKWACSPNLWKFFACHRYPPMLMPSQGSHFEPCDATWPEVDAGDWCGEWQPREESVDE